MQHMAPALTHTETPFIFTVQVKAAQYLNELAQLGVAGVRIDAAKHMNKWDLGSILQVCLFILLVVNDSHCLRQSPCTISEEVCKLGPVMTVKSRTCSG